MQVVLSEKDVRKLIKYNLRKRRKGIRKFIHLPIIYPYTCWIDENGNGTMYHCARCGYKSITELEQCPDCDSNVILNYRYDNIREILKDM